MNPWGLIPLVSCLVFAFLFALVLPQAKTRANRVFSTFLFASAAWSFTSFMLVYNPSASEKYLLFWNGLVGIAISWVVVAYYHFIRAYNNRRGGFGLYLGYAFVLFMAALSLSGHFVKSARLDHGYLIHDIKPWDYVIAAAVVPLLAAIIASLVQRYRHATSVADRNRTLYLMVGWGLLLVLSYITPFTALSGLPTDHIGNLFNALIIAYAVYRLHLLDVRFVLRRGLAFTIIGVGIVSVSLGVSLLSQFLFPERQTLILVFVTVAVVLALVILGRPVVVAVQRAVDRLFFGETYMYRESLLAFSTKIGNIIELKELAEQMLSPICQALRITEARLMFQQNGNGRFTCQYVNPATESRERDISLSLDNPIVQLLQKEDEPLDLKQIDVIPQLKGLWEADRERLANSGLEFLQPIKSHTQLIGILALGKKKSGGLYLAEDIDLIKNMSAQAAIIVDNARLYSQAVTWANTDGLTEIYNHRHFHERIDQEIARGSRFGSMFSLIIIDLDHFKTFNDNYGHLAGDEVLRRTASCIQSSIRTIDMAFRYGGEEFAVILPGTRLSDGQKVAERIRNTIETKASAGTIPVTASLGVASWPIDGMAKQDVIARADLALYQAKQTGRNRVVLSSEVVKGQTSLIGMELETKERAVSIIYALAATVDAKDHYTYGHSKKVSQYAVGMAEAMKLTSERVAVIRAAGLLHDIGKIAVPDSILNKAGPLTDEEWEPIKAHPELGMEILKHVIDLVNVLPGILHHHERFDGHGYPGALKGEEIPLEARVLAIADAYDAITSMRPYHTQMSTQEAIDELRRCAGKQFDPELVEVFCSSIERGLPRHIGVE